MLELNIERNTDSSDSDDESYAFMGNLISFKHAFVIKFDFLVLKVIE